ncbi:hypothetical protein U9M48_029397 [Paspalum notatum var. saurae]|uniref:Uncharacterized protein n=1 Tax=Paspalum notatum var. saurae TaxID=547442 RepID=A0AAQ3TYG5_PASNO
MDQSNTAAVRRLPSSREEPVASSCSRLSHPRRARLLGVGHYPFASPPIGPPLAFSLSLPSVSLRAEDRSPSQQGAPLPPSLPPGSPFILHRSRKKIGEDAVHPKKRDRNGQDGQAFNLRWLGYGAAPIKREANSSRLRFNKVARGWGLRVTVTDLRARAVACTAWASRVASTTHGSEARGGTILLIGAPAVN